jgi:T4-like virus tail tube protein gp19
VVLLDGQRTPLIGWSFRNAWSVKYESPVLNGEESAIAIETLELAVEGVNISSFAQGTWSGEGEHGPRTYADLPHAPER